MISLKNDRTDTYVSRIREEIKPEVSCILPVKVLWYPLATS